MLLAYNLTTSLIVLGKSKVPTLPKSRIAGRRGVPVNVSAYVKSLSISQLASLESTAIVNDVHRIIFAWSSNAVEFPTPGLSTYLPFETPEAVDVDVAPSVASGGSGSDAAGEGDVSSPFETWGRALARTPPSWSGRVHHHLASGVMQAGNLNPFIPTPSNGSTTQLPAGTPIAVLGTPIDVGGGTRTESNGGSSQVLTDASANFPALTGAAVRITSGPGTALYGQRRLIRSNTATTLTVLTPFGSPVPVGTTFDVERPGSTLTWPSGRLVVAAGFLGFRDVRFLVPANGALIFTDHCQCHMENVEIDLTGPGAGLRVMRFSALQAQSGGGPWTNDRAANPFSNPMSGDRASCGVYLKGSQTSSVGISDQAILTGNIVCENASIAATGGGQILLAQIYGKNCTLSGDHRTQVNITGLAAQPSRLDGQSTASPATGIVNYNGRATGTLGYVEIVNSGGHGVFAKEDSYCVLGTVSGGTNAGVGIKYVKGSRVMIDSRGTATSVTGAGGDTEGTRAQDGHSYSVVRKPDGFGVKGSSDPYGCRIEPEA